MPELPKSPRHALYIGWVFGHAMRAGLDCWPVPDQDGNLTDTLRLEVKTLALDVTVDVVVPEPPDEWVFDDAEAAARAVPQDAASDGSDGTR